jgi:hypothetical protein
VRHRDLSNMPSFAQDDHFPGVLMTSSSDPDRSSGRCWTGAARRHRPKMGALGRCDWRNPPHSARCSLLAQKSLDVR